jgi:hypothetical protein
MYIIYIYILQFDIQWCTISMIWGFS